MAVPLFRNEELRLGNHIEESVDNLSPNQQEGSEEGQVNLMEYRAQRSQGLGKMDEKRKSTVHY